MRVLIIANPIAGGGKGKLRAEALHRALTARMDGAELLLTAAAGDGRAAAENADADGIIVVGGDGTVNEVLNGMADDAPWLAVFPVGSANVVARTLAMPRDVEQMAALAEAGPTRRVDVGCCAASGARGEKRFLLGAGAGLDAAVVAEVHARRGKSLGLRKWVRPALTTARRYAYPPIRVTVDGAPLCDDASYVVLGNCRYSAGIIPATPEARIDDGLLDVCALRHTGILRLARIAAATFRPGFTERGDVLYAQGRDIRFEPAGAEAPPLQIDGDPAGCAPAEFSILPGALQVLAAPGA